MALGRATYLRKRPRGWIFRRAIPQDLRARFSLREIVRTLADIPQSRAAFEARAMGFACEDLFMSARADVTLSRDQLHAVAATIAASKRSMLEGYSKRPNERDPQGAYEDMRDVAISSVQAAAEGRSIFEPLVVLELAEEAGIPLAHAQQAMPLLQQLMARATSGYCIDLAQRLKPAKPARQSFLNRLFTGNDNQDERFDEAVDRFRALGPLVPANVFSPESDDTPIDSADASVIDADIVSKEPESFDDPARRREIDPPVHDAVTIPTPPTTIPSPQASADQGPLFSTYWPRFVAEKTGPQGSWSKSRLPELEGSLRLVCRLIGDVPLSSLTRDQASLLKTRYFGLPSDHKNLWVDRKTGKERSYNQLMAYVAQIEKKQAVKRVTAKTWNKQRGNYSAHIQFLKANFDIFKNLDDVFADLSVKIEKTVATVRLERSMAPTLALVALFGLSIWRGRNSAYFLMQQGPLIIRDSLYWIPLLEACLGARREEVAQLRVRHIATKFGILGINLFAEDLRIKTDDASRRWIPLSQAVLDLGFVECLLAGRKEDELLFPELSDDNAHGSYGDSFGKRFLRYAKLVKVDFAEAAKLNLEGIQISKDEYEVVLLREVEFLVAEFRSKVSNHGVRHWFRTIAENTEGVKTLFVDEIMGHAGEQKSEGSRRYFKEAYVQNLKRTIDLIPLPFDPVELRRLAEESERNHPWLIEERRGPQARSGRSSRA